MVSNVVNVTETGDLETSRCVILVDLAFIARRCVFIGQHRAVVNHNSTGITSRNVLTARAPALKAKRAQDNRRNQ